METKESIKISLSTFILIIAVIVIVIMGYFIYKISKEKTLLDKENSNLESEISSLKIDTNNIKNTSETISNTVVASNSTNNALSSTTTNTSLTEAEALKIATNTYEKAYKMFRSRQFTIDGNYNVNGKQQSCYKVNISELEKVFSKRAIEKIKGSLWKDNGEYYDIAGENNNNKFFDSIDVATIFSNVDSGIRPLSIIEYNDKYIIANGKLESGEHTTGDEFPLYIIFTKENGNWLIDLYE